MTGPEALWGATAAMSILIAGLAVWLSLCVRSTGVDQPYLMLLAQEVLFGRHPELIDFPSSVYISAPPLYAARLLGWPIVFSWNLYVTALSAVSACIFGLRASTRHPAILTCLWLGTSLLLFDDALIGQREHFFAMFWLPYLLCRLARPSTSRARALDFVCGLLLSVPISAKFYFAAFVVLIDLPILLLRRQNQSLAAFSALVAGGVLQTAIFFVTIGLDLGSLEARLRSYYGAVGVDYGLVLDYLLHLPAVHASVAALAVVIVLNAWVRRPNAYAWACAATGIVCLALSVLQGQPRAYTVIPLYLSAIACLLEALLVEGEPVKTERPRSWRRPILSAALALVAYAALLADNGLGRAMLMKYIWGQPEYARIGPAAADGYLTWVQSHVSASDEIDPIALQYGSSAFDPILSTIELGRRVNSANPILQLPLRAALISGDQARIDAAWDGLINEISTARFKWVVIRRTTPAPMEPDFIKIMESEPRFYSWFIKHYARYDTFDPYVAYRRLD